MPIKYITKKEKIRIQITNTFNQILTKDKINLTFDYEKLIQELMREQSASKKMVEEVLDNLIESDILERVSEIGLSYKQREKGLCPDKKLSDEEKELLKPIERKDEKTKK
jgi:hypothetical protein